jgi:hypothetical protein
MAAIGSPINDSSTATFTMQELTELLATSTAAIERGYFGLNIDGGDGHDDDEF